MDFTLFLDGRRGEVSQWELAGSGEKQESIETYKSANTNPGGMNFATAGALHLKHVVEWGLFSVDGAKVSDTVLS